MEDLQEESASSRPVVGVFVGVERIAQLNEQKCDFRTYYWFRELFKANDKAKVTLYLFTTNDVDIDTAQVTGTYFDDASGEWLRRTFPYPDVLYIRGVTKTQNYEFKNLLHHFDGIGVKRINAKYLFNKWDVYKKLKRVRTIKPYLPETVRIKDESDLNSFLKKYRNIYIKAYYGSLGRQVIRVSKLHRLGYEYSYNHMGSLTTGLKQHVKELFEVIHSVNGNRQIMAQHSIDVIRLQDRNVDFRAEVQRNNLGKLEVAGIAARIGMSCSPITTHADVVEFDDFWRSHFQYSSSELKILKQKINKFLTLAFSALEEAYGTFGDLGIDFAIDRWGRVWFIECNGRSAKMSFVKSANEEAVERGFLNLLEYAKFLYLSNDCRQMVQNDKSSADSEDIGPEVTSIMVQECIEPGNPTT